MKQPEVRASSMTQRANVPAAGRYRLDPGRSSVGFRTRHLFGLATVSGTMRVAAGEIVVDPEAPQASVTASVAAASFSTDNDRRDRDVRSAKFLHAEKYPYVTFRAGTLSQAQGRWVLSGELTVRDVSSPVRLAIESVEPAGKGFRALATTRIDRFAFGLTAARGMAARFLDIELTAIAEPL